MFISKIISCCVVFTPHGCVLHDLATGRIIGWVNNTQAYTTCPSSKPSSHISNIDRLWFMTQAPRTSFSGVSTTCIFLTTYSKNLILIHNNGSICPKAKQTRLPFPLSTIKSHSPFNLLHCNIWGPHKTPTHFGKHFFVTIVDDYT